MRNVLGSTPAEGRERMQRKAEGEPSFRDAQDSLSKFGGKLAHYGGPLEEPLSWLEVARGYYLPPSPTPVDQSCM